MAVRMEVLNGKHYLGTQEGEVLKTDPLYAVLFPHECPSANNPFENVNLSQEQSDLFLTVNVRHLAAITKNDIRVVTDVEAGMIAFHRLLAVKEGLISPKFDENNFHVNYSDAIQMTVAQTNNALALDNLEILVPPEAQKDIGETFTDRLSLIAFVFRGRGHHYMADYEELFRRVWRKCRYNENQLHLSWQFIATASFHAIFPVILDDFWGRGSRAGFVNGALIKRYDVASAGTAGPLVLRQGILDLVMIAPGVRFRLSDSISYLDDVIRQIQQHRYAGSVNHRYYGAPRVAFDEKRLGAVAATIISAIDNLTEDAPLGKSPALRRIATNAPITGAVLGRAIGQISNRPEVVDSLLEREAPVSNRHQDVALQPNQ